MSVKCMKVKVRKNIVGYNDALEEGKTYLIPYESIFIQSNGVAIGKIYDMKGETVCQSTLNVFYTIREMKE